MDAKRFLVLVKRCWWLLVLKMVVAAGANASTSRLIGLVSHGPISSGGSGFPRLTFGRPRTAAREPVGTDLGSAKRSAG
jgi:hypothetical protein